MRLTQTIAILVLGVVALSGCRAKREELGYGFYSINKPEWQVIRRERDENGDIVDVVWFPDRVIDDEHRFLFGCGDQHNLVYAKVPVDIEPLPNIPRTHRAYLDRLHSIVTFTAIRLERAEIEELGTYADSFGKLDESHPARLNVDTMFEVFIGITTFFHPLEEGSISSSALR